MKIGRMVRGGVVDWVVTSREDAWIFAGDLGVGMTALGDVARSLPRLREALASDDVTSKRETGRLVCPVTRPGKIVAAGANYLAHVKEAGLETPKAPMLFAKYPSSLNDPDGNIELDLTLTHELDYEAELAVVIGRTARRVSEASALEHVLGYAVANDISARDVQRADGQISRSKSMDTFCPIGPWITTADEISDPQALRIRSLVNGEVRQDSFTSDMIFSTAYLIAYLSRTMTLEPGDVILTGTPEGTALGQRPPAFLRPGDIVRCEVEGLGSIENRVVEVGP